MEKMKAVNRIREFNRFYTVQQGFLNGNYLDTDYSVTETRILFEIHQNESISANYLVDLLHMDKGYISRLISRFEKNGLLIRSQSEKDNRAKDITLTGRGRKAAEELIAVTNRAIGDMISGLSKEECSQLCAALDDVTALLSKIPKKDGGKDGQ